MVGSICTSRSIAAPARSPAGGSTYGPGRRRRSAASSRASSIAGCRRAGSPSGQTTAVSSPADFRKHLSARGVTHRRGGYRDPESQAFIESWFGQFKKRCAWRAEWETIEHARTEIADYIHRYHHRPHSGIGYRTPTEVAATWRPDPETQMKLAT
jgi:transposase InsO family protein